MVARFEEIMTSRHCEIVKPVFYTPEAKCEGTVAKGAEVLEQVIAEWDAEREQVLAELKK